MKKVLLTVLLILALASTIIAQKVTTRWASATIFRTEEALVATVMTPDWLEIDTLKKTGGIVVVPRGTECSIINRNDFILEVKVKGLSGTWFVPQDVFRTDE